MRTVLLLLVLGLLVAWFFYRKGLDSPKDRQDRRISSVQSSNCECHFVHHNDRRAGKDRRSPFTSGGLAGATGKYAQERREGKERRDDSEGGDLY
jgi:hypothetical protein